MPNAADFEKLGVFYLGRPYDWQQKKAQDGLILYDSKDLVTHAVCVGMTGSGKTGLCLALIEEAAIDGIPAILIDPKGDLANLLLTFPALRPEDFRPWINEDDARRKNLSADDYARQQAEQWQKGLTAWGEDGARIQRLRDAADFAVYTPLQSRGLVLAVLASSVVGLIADSILFLWLAFGSLDFLAGQILGKLWMVVLSLPFIHWIRKREIARQVAVT